MARATKTSNSTSKPRGAVKEAPKRKPGRPIGSTGAKKSGPASAAKTVKPAGRRSAVARPVARVAKPNKAELENQLGKLERTVARLRDKNKELKQIASEAREHADTLEAQLAARPAAKAPTSAAKPARKSRRPAQPAHETVADDGVPEQSDDAAPED